MKKMLGKRFMFLVALLVGLCMPAMAQKYYNFNAVALDVDGLPQKVTSWYSGNAGVIINPNSPDQTGTNYISDYVVKQDWGIVGVSQDFNFHPQFISKFTETIEKEISVLQDKTSTASINITPTAKSGTASDDYATINYSASSYGNNKLQLGASGTLSVSISPKKSDETLTITSVQISYPKRSGSWGSYTYYYGNNLKATADGVTVACPTSGSGSSAGSFTISNLNANKLELTNGTGTTALHITKIVVNYKRLYKELGTDTEEISVPIYAVTANPAGTNNANIVSGQNRTSNDGICLAYSASKNYSVSGGSKIPWTSYSNEDENDDFVTRGYRMYTVTIATGVLVDVYVLDMDASERTSDINARNAQLTQLANAILANTNGRPMIVMGTFNSLYTREKLEENFIDRINNGGKGLTIKDAWVEFMRGGKYPVYGTDPELANTGYYDGQRGEAYNKVFFVNKTGANLTIKANSYERKEDFGQGDHKPILVNFTIIDASATSSNSDWTVDVDGTEDTDEAIVGSQVTSNTTYYIQNVSTGLYLKAGAQWGAQACEGSAGMPIKIVASGSKYSLQTLNGSISAVPEPYMDNHDNTTWTLQRVGTTSYQYYLKINDTQALSSTGDLHGVVRCVTFNSGDDKQKWVLLTENDIKTQMRKASAKNPFDITPLVKAAGFDPMDINTIVNSTSNTTYVQNTSWGSTLKYHHEYTANMPRHNGIAYYYENLYDESDKILGFIPNPNYNATKAVKVTHSMTNMPAGIYTVSFEGYYSARALSSAFGAGIIGNRQYFPWNVKVSLGNDYTYVLQNVDGGFDNASSAAKEFRDNDNFRSAFKTINTTDNATLNLIVDAPSFSGGNSDRTVWLALDNFVIKYLGTESDNADMVKKLVGDYINMTAEKVEKLNAAGQAAYDISEVLYRYNNDLLSIDGSVEIAMIDAAYEIALAAHNAKELEEKLEENNGDVTGYIVNPSFEYNNGSTYGWIQDPASEWMDANCIAGGEANIHGTYRFNAWCGGPAVTPIMQTVTGLKNGLYELKALIASDAGNVVYIIGNDSHIGKVAEGGDKFVESTLEFLVEDGTAKIGAVGGYQGHFYITGGWYKVDNFRLKYICDVAHGRVYLAHKEASAAYATLDKFGKEYADGKAESYPTGETPLSTLLNTYKNANTTQISSLVNSNGVKESSAIYSSLTEAAFRQKTIGADMTWCFGDPSFEIGKFTQYWSMSTGDTWGEFLAARQDDAQFSAVGVDGAYLLNVYDWNGTDALETTIGATNSIPNGIYEITAMVTTDNGCSVYIDANGETSNPVKASDLVNGDGIVILPAGRRMFPINHRFEVSDGTAKIKVYAKNSEGKDHNFFKADDFRLHIRLLASNQEPTEKYPDNNTLYLDENSVDIPELPVLTKNAENANFQYNSVEIARSIKPNTWSTLVVPFDMNVSELGNGNWDVRELTSVEIKPVTQEDGTVKDDVVLTFTTPSDGVINQGKCYIVRHDSETLSAIRIDKGTDFVSVNTKNFDDSFNTENNSMVKFIGTYTSGYVPYDQSVGDYYFITTDKTTGKDVFKKTVAAGKNKIKGFRAYFLLPKSSNARGLGFRVEETTGLAPVENNQEVTVVGIYNLNGVRLNDMETGVNILHMSDGSSMKVIIK